MSNPPNIRNFSAWLNRQPPGPSKTIVIGEVETPSSIEVPILAAKLPSSALDGVLKLDLSIQNTGGIGTQAFQYHNARFETEANQYQSVEIHWDGELLTTLMVSSVS
jgi:hypothetical protein